MQHRSEPTPSPLSPSSQLSSPSITSRPKSHPDHAARIDNLPTELLVQILLLSLILNDEMGADDLLFGMAPLGQLRSVCTQWNGTILGEPAFWTHIAIETGPRTVELKLLRSGALPLTIQYSSFEEGADSEEEHSEFLRSMDLIGRHTHRWKSISFWAPDWQLDKLTDYLDGSPLPEMESLKLRMRSTSGNLLVWTCDYAASPRNVLFNGRALPWNPGDFSSLVKLEIEGEVGRLDLLVALVQASQSLELMRLINIQFEDSVAEVQQNSGWLVESRPSLLPKLSNVQILGLQSPVAIAWVLRSIRVPNIRILNIIEGHITEVKRGGQIVRALTTDHGSQSILTSILHNISSPTTVEIWCFPSTMRLDMENPDKGSRRLQLFFTRADWEESATMIGETLRVANVAIYLRLERLPLTFVAIVLSVFPPAVELGLAGFSSQDILRILRVLSSPLDVGGGAKMWLCPQLAKIRLPGGWLEAEAATIAESATSLKHARRNLANQSTIEDNGGDMHDVRDEVRVLVGGSEI
ncbi:hypothetical protein FRC04_003252 [Tulasnella sp. 424]|nr:hypothetical protein FRC04_003252 [Tulasnella sp. 424]KAG8965956.1 hypothetical protein FRC05_002947 [Tulasnella sp. 425]